MLIKEEIKTFEKNLFNNTIEEYDYYNNLINNKQNEDIFWDIFYSLSNVKEKKILNYKKNFILKIKDLDLLRNFIKIKNNNDLFNFMISICILKIFSKGSIFDLKEKKIINIYDVSNSITSEMEKIFIFIEIKNKIKLNLNQNELWNIIMKILIYLIDEKKIKFNYIRNKKKLNKFLYIDNIKIETNIILSYEKYNIYENKYIYSNHFCLTNKIFKENTKSGYSFKTDTNSELFKNLTNNWIYLDKNRLNDILIDIKKEYNFLNKDIEKEYIDLKKKIIDSLNKENISKISKEITILQNILKIENILKLDINNKKIYLPFTLDFRGRLYYESEISPSFYKEFRYCMNWGYYSEFDEKNHIFNSVINEEIIKYINLLDNLEIVNLSKKDKSIKISLIWILISLGELNKSKLGKEVKIVEFIKEGIKVLKNDNLLDYDLYDKIKIKYLKNIIFEINKNIYIKWLISKDATASVYQHLVKACGHKNDFVLKWCNLKSINTWYDTYSYIIEDFLITTKTKELTKDELVEVINRKNLKKIIMTENYSASLRTCRKYFLENININEYNEEKKKEILRIFEDFYKYISTNKKMFENDISNILEYFKKNDYILYLNNESKDVIILKYYKGMKKQKEVTINKKRYTYQEYHVKKILDLSKIKTSIKANYIHAMDASLIRWFLSYNKALTIHDCFFIDYINLTYLTSCINEGMRIGFHDINKINTGDIFSIFIIL